LETFAACCVAGKSANENGIPVVLDPVGVGASYWRKEKVRVLLQEVSPDILRVNAAEAMVLLDMGQSMRQGMRSIGCGVDSFETGIDPQQLAKSLAQKYDCVVLLSGQEDVIAARDGKRCETVAGGSALMRQITGAGCMLSALCGTFAAVEPDAFAAAAAAAQFWKVCAAQAAAQSAGLGQFHVALLDCASQIAE
jgi:hydroxyethylthiazole kinase